MRVLVVNAGSSSLKVRLLDGTNLLGSWSQLPDPPPPVDAVGHRIVHGGSEFTAPVVVDDAVEARLRAIADLAPLHQAKSLAALDAAKALVADAPHVACFDTAFHSTLPPEASTYALPREWLERFQIRRYGFHGLSHAWAGRRALEMVPGARRVVTCHLGAGASLAAIVDGVCVDTTMGFTPLEGLVMATRSGSVDPGLVLWLQDHDQLSARELAEVFEHRSGVLGLCGTSDMREVLERADPAALLARDVYLHRLAAAVASMAVATRGLDVLVFTGGVGENAASLRAAAADRLGLLGIAVDADRNAAARPDCDIGQDGAPVRTLVIAAREDLEIAQATARLLQG